jgi:ABC-type glutathione transport system ATPase component
MTVAVAAVRETPAPMPQRKPRPLLEIEDLWVAFPRYKLEPLEVLRRIDLEMAPGEVLGLVGESGSGKTMLARTIMQLIPVPGRIERGHLHFDGRDLAAWMRRRSGSCVAATSP